MKVLLQYSEIFDSEEFYSGDVEDLAMEEFIDDILSEIPTEYFKEKFKVTILEADENLNNF